MLLVVISLNWILLATLFYFVQAAKEFETELKKDTEGSSEPPPAESSKAVSSEDEKKQLETSGTNESL